MLFVPAVVVRAGERCLAVRRDRCVRLVGIGCIVVRACRGRRSILAVLRNCRWFERGIQRRPVIEYKTLTVVVRAAHFLEVLENAALG